jgi:hypothetical protein
VANLKYLHDTIPFPDAIVYADRSVNEAPHADTTPHWATDIGKALQNLDVVENRAAKSFRSFRKMGPGVGQNLCEVG